MDDILSPPHSSTPPPSQLALPRELLADIRLPLPPAPVQPTPVEPPPITKAVIREHLASLGWTGRGLNKEATRLYSKSFSFLLI